MKSSLTLLIAISICFGFLLSASSGSAFDFHKGTVSISVGEFLSYTLSSGGDLYEDLDYSVQLNPPRSLELHYFSISGFAFGGGFAYGKERLEMDDPYGGGTMAAELVSHEFSLSVYYYHLTGRKWSPFAALKLAQSELDYDDSYSSGGGYKRTSTILEMGAVYHANETFGLNISYLFSADSVEHGDSGSIHKLVCGMKAFL